MQRTRETMTYLVCKTRDYNRGIRSSFPSDVHTSILHQRNRTRFWHTTNIRAFDGGYTRAGTRMRPIFCKGLVTNVYTPSYIELALLSLETPIEDSLLTFAGRLWMLG